MQVIVGNLKVEYSVEGTGEVVLMLHGWADSLKTFDLLSNSLSKKYKVIRLDLPGFGATEAPATAWKLSDYATFVESFIAKVREQEGLYAVVGHSNGGAIAMHGVASGAIKPKKLILIASSGIRHGNAVKKLVLNLIAKTGKVLTLPLPPHVRRKLRLRLYSSAGSDALVAPGMQQTFNNIVAEDILQKAGDINIPTLLLYGAEDKATPVAYGKKFSEAISGSRLDVISGAGHFVHQTRSAQISKVIEEFLRPN